MEFLNHQGKIVGKLWPDKVFRKEVSKKKHFLWSTKSWAIDADILKKLQDNGCKEIRIKDNDEGIVYSIPLVDFQFQSELIDYGHGKQLAVPASKFLTKLINKK